MSGVNDGKGAAVVGFCNATQATLASLKPVCVVQCVTKKDKGRACWLAAQGWAERGVALGDHIYAHKLVANASNA